MKQLLLFTAFLFLNLNFAQNNISNITGNWVKLKIEMKDGSKLFDRFMEDSTYLKCAIGPNKFSFYHNPMNNANFKDTKLDVDYTLVNNIMKTSQYSGYLVEKITNDSLILSEKITDLTDDKLKRFFFVREELILSQYKDKYKNKSSIIASKLFTPKVNLSLQQDLSFAFKNNNSNFSAVGNILIFPKEKRIKTTIVFSTLNDSSSIKKIKKVVDKSFEYWDLKNFENYDSIELPFVLRNKKTKEYKQLTVIFLTKDTNELEILIGGKLEDSRKSEFYFQKAIQSYQEKNFLKAVEYFNESYKSDPKNLDALYNKAATYFESGDKYNACRTWKQISDLGQVNGKELYLNNCQ